MFWALGIAKGMWTAPGSVKVDFLTLSTAVALCVWTYQCLALLIRHRLITLVHLLKIIGAVTVACLSLLTLYMLPTRALWPTPIVIALLALSACGFGRRRAAIVAAGVLVFAAAGLAVATRAPAVRERIEALADPVETHFETRQGQLAAHSVKWRLIFWRRCVQETVRHAPVFGLGFGTNLTDLLRETPDWSMYEDSQNAGKYGAPNRHPHCAHVTVFARLGALGLLIWFALLGSVFVQGLKNCWQYRDEDKTRFFSEITILSVWSIYVLAMTFGVVLENPFGGIWFWSLTGVIANRTAN